MSPEMITALGVILLGLVAQTIQAHNTKREMKAKIGQVGMRLDHEMSPNHGTSMKDALNRIEAAQHGMLRDIGRLADADLEMGHDKSEEHKRIHHRIDKLESKHE